jgi:hypothetical protein
MPQKIFSIQLNGQKGNFFYASCMRTVIYGVLAIANKLLNSRNLTIIYVILVVEVIIKFVPDCPLEAKKNLFAVDANKKTYLKNN